MGTCCNTLPLHPHDQPRGFLFKGPDSATFSDSSSRESVSDGDAILRVAEKEEDQSVAHQRMAVVRHTLPHGPVAQDRTQLSLSRFSVDSKGHVR